MVPYRPDLPEVAASLDLHLNFFGYKSGAIDGMTIAKDQRLAEELAELFQNGWEADDRCRRIGTLLGYPKSAIDYYLQRRFTLEKNSELPMIIPEAIVGTIHKVFCQFNLSPEHWREEIDAYVMPLENAVRNLTPATFRRIEERVRTYNVAGTALKVAGVRTMLVSDGAALQKGKQAA